MGGYVLDVEQAGHRRLGVPVYRSPFTIGRDPTCAMVLQGTSVSRFHATLYETADGLSLVDEGSRNGVLVNGQRVSGRQRLQPGDTLQIGTSSMVVRSADLPEFRVKTEPTDTIQFFPSQGTWDASSRVDPARTLPPRKTARAIADWTRSLPAFLLEATPERTYETLLDTIQSLYAFDRCFIVLIEKDQADRANVVAQRLRTVGPSRQMIVSTGVLARVIGKREAVFMTTRDPESSATKSFLESGAACALCVPLIVGGKVTGVIYMDHLSSATHFGMEDVESLGPFAGVAALKLENLRLLKEQIGARLVMREMELARGVQESLLPRAGVAVPGYAVEGYSTPCLQVGGDYYDIRLQRDGRVGLVIGDVSGKGLASALYMTDVRATLQAHLDDGVPLSELMALIARRVQDTFRPEDFLTLFLARLDPADGNIEYCNAGHLPPMGVREAGDVLELEVTDPALNIGPCAEYHRREHRLAPGDLLLLYTDGLIEAEGEGGEMFGSDRLLACLSRSRGQDLPGVRGALLAELEEFAGGRRPSDDRTLLLVRREGG